MASTANPVFAKATANLAVENQKEVETNSMVGRPSLRLDVVKTRECEVSAAKCFSKRLHRQSTDQIHALLVRQIRRS